MKKSYNNCGFLNTPLLRQAFFVFGTFCAISGVGSASTLVFEDDFDREDFRPYDYAGKGDVWSLFPTTWSSGTIQTAGDQLHVTTPELNGESRIAIAEMSAMSDFDTSLAGQGTVSLSFDYKVNGFSGEGTGQNAIQIGLYTGGSTGRLFLGFGEVTVDGIATNALYIASWTNNVATVDDIIGYNASTNEWVDGFNFGAYDGENASNNGTSQLGISLNYNSIDGTRWITVDEAGGNVATKTITGSGATWDNDTQSASIRLYSPYSGSSDYTLDNMVLQTIPEPSTAMFLTVFLLGFAAIRLRR
ncbi:hypothetical protein [Puniceicoccus vermicola]|nr:hypothetical protein [Puniceicoccus vermicola]